MPRRNDDSVRVGLNAIVRSRISSKLSKNSGPSMNCAIAVDFSRFTPGVTSTSTSWRTRSGARSASAIDVRPPSDIPTTTRASGASSRTACSTATALSAGQYTWSERCDECPWPGRSIAASGRPSASATVSQVCAFWAPPCTSTSSGASRPTSARRSSGRHPRGPRRAARRARRATGCRTRQRSRGTARTRRTSYQPCCAVDLRARGRCNYEAPATARPPRLRMRRQADAARRR